MHRSRIRSRLRWICGLLAASVFANGCQSGPKGASLVTKSANSGGRERAAVVASQPAAEIFKVGYETPAEREPRPLDADEPRVETLDAPHRLARRATDDELKTDDQPPGRDNGRPISLVAVLEVVDRDGAAVNLARHRVEEAYAVWQRADSLWLPSLRAGLNFNRHEGRIQDVLGSNVETSRGAFYTGLGANAVGAGSPAIPGIYANFHLTDAVFQPRIAGHAAEAREAGAEVALNDALFQAAQAYLELLRAEQERAVALEVRERADELVRLTEAYAKTGQGLAADHDRARTERDIRGNDVLRAEESVAVASARLAQLLRLDPSRPLEPLEPALAPIHLFDGGREVQGLVAQALGARPELRESRALVCEAVNRLERERYAPLIPSVLLGVSQGGFSAGRGGDVGGFADRFDADVAAWWEVRNLGQGEVAARREMRSRLEQARWREVAIMDQVAREVVETHAQVTSRKRQLQAARDAVSSAQSSYSRNLDRIQNGQGLPLETLQSLQALAQAQREYIRIVADYNVAQFALQRAVGSLPDETRRTAD